MIKKCKIKTRILITILKIQALIMTLIKIKENQLVKKEKSKWMRNQKMI